MFSVSDTQRQGDDIAPLPRALIERLQRLSDRFSIGVVIFTVVYFAGQFVRWWLA